MSRNRFYVIFICLEIKNLFIQKYVNPAVFGDQVIINNNMLKKYVFIYKFYAYSLNFKHFLLFNSRLPHKSLKQMKQSLFQVRCDRFLLKFSRLRLLKDSLNVKVAIPSPFHENPAGRPQNKENLAEMKIIV